MSSIEAQFHDTVQQVRNSEPGTPPPPEQQLKLYALYKQATEGDVKGKPPSLLNPVARAKHKAWAALEGTSQDDAMQEYIQSASVLLKGNN